MTSISLTVNGKVVSADVDTRMVLADFLRNKLRLTGTHIGCDTSQCGCCVVHVNGKSVKSCTMLAVAAQDAEVVTIEGLSVNDGGLHPLQAAFREHHGLQCGYCTPGVLMSVAELLHYNPQPSEKEIRKWLEGNLCRCTGYHNIVKAIQGAVGPIGE